MERKMEDESKNNRKKIMIKSSLSKSISSPSRNERFPPPLMRFLRSNVGSKSRGRSRSSPMMFMRRKNNAAVIETTQEPSSPKVTCIGQVRVRRSSKSKVFSRNSSTKQPKKRNNSSSFSNQTPCWWVKKALNCNHFFPRFCKPSSICSILSKWGSFFCCGYCKKVDFSEDFSSKVESLPRSHNNGDSICSTTSTTFEAQIEESKEVLMDSTPPKNAFLLTRCRSAPYRSSSLANRFWGSPSKDDDDEEEKVEEKAEESMAEPRFSSQSEEMKSSSIDERSKVSKSIQDLRAAIGGGASVHPLILTRCKSEPARTGERLNPDGHQSCSQVNNNL